jgi:hypothetical protein
MQAALDPRIRIRILQPDLSEGIRLELAIAKQCIAVIAPLTAPRVSNNPSAEVVVVSDDEDEVCATMWRIGWAGWRVIHFARGKIIYPEVVVDVKPSYDRTDIGYPILFVHLGERCCFGDASCATITVNTGVILVRIAVRREALKIRDSILHDPVQCGSC